MLQKQRQNDKPDVVKNLYEDAEKYKRIIILAKFWQAIFIVFFVLFSVLVMFLMMTGAYVWLSIFLN